MLSVSCICKSTVSIKPGLGWCASVPADGQMACGYGVRLHTPSMSLPGLFDQVPFDGPAASINPFRRAEALQVPHVGGTMQKCHASELYMIVRI